MTAWQTEFLGDVCETGAGGTPLSSKKEYYEGGDIPWLLSGEVAQGEVLQATKFITEKGLANSSAKIFPRNTILVAMYGATAGQVGILRIQAATNQAVCGIYPNQRFIPEFLYYLFQHRKDELVAQATGNAQPNISQIKIRSTPVPILPLSEQRRIVGILDETFEGIATAKANAEKNLQNARALSRAQVDSEFTKQTGTWPMKRLADLCGRVSVGHVGPTSSFYCEPSNGVPFLRSQNVRRGRLDLNGIQYVTNDFHRKLRKSQLRPGDVLFVRVGANRGDCCSVPENVVEMNCANIVFARPVAGHARFIERYCGSTHGRRQLLGMTTGSAQGVINTSSVAELETPFPPLLEQERVLARMEQIDVQTTQLESIYEQKLASLDSLRKSLLHQAFTGQL